MARDPEILAHQEWLGFVQPIGLVVSIPALLAAEAYVSRNIGPIHQKFLSCLHRDGLDEPLGELADFALFARNVLEWEPSDLVRLPEDSLPSEFAELEVVLPEYGERLRPTFVIPELKPKEGQSRWIMLVQVLANTTSLDEASAHDKHGWQASPQAKFERLLRETEVPIGLIVNDTHLRLVYAPRGETSGHITFSVANMMQVAGRPIFAALHMLLSNERLFLQNNEKQRLPSILADSRKYQNTVSTKLAEQVLAALYELLRGFQAANEQRHGALLREILTNNPDHVYAGLLTVLMRLVFVLYAEDRSLLSNSSVYTNFYSVSGLFERLREDAGRYPDTIDHRFGAWAQLLTLFRLIFDGGSHGDLSIPARKGHLFDPDRYPFLEGRTASQQPRPTDWSIPHVSDGTIYRVLCNLLVLDAERLSYRTLDVEQIGSVYEAIMGFGLEEAQGPSIAIRAKKQHGAPTCINLQELLTTKQSDRPKWFQEQTDQEITGATVQALKDATTIGDLLFALEKKIALRATPHVVPKGNMLLQPSDERRKSGSHYTPRSLTEPIVRATLKPILNRLGPQVTPQQILELNVCDPAMGSGAFLVEACRQLAEELVKAWHVHDCVPPVPPDEDEILHARRLVAQRCLYGVDKNPMAVDLAKLSLWLATLAKDHPFTFLDHTLRCGDSLVGLTRDQIIRFHWQPDAQRSIDEKLIKRCIDQSTSLRKEILDTAERTLYPVLQIKLSEADRALAPVRLIGDAAVAAFFAAETDNLRRKRRDDLLPQVSLMLSQFNERSLSTLRWESLPLVAEARVTYEASKNRLSDFVKQLRSGTNPVLPFHWEIEFPEIFERHNSGFDVVVGNPPFAGKNTLINSNRDGYLEWIRTIHTESHGNADLVAHFFRRSFSLLRTGGCFGLIATNTIGQGDTRSTGLRWICTHGGTIFATRKRCVWPGQAAVVVSVVHVCRGAMQGPYQLDNRLVPLITAYLFHAGGHDNANKLSANENMSFIGSYVLGMGFTFDDTDTKGVASPIAEMHRLIQKDPRNAERIFPYLGGEELVNSPRQLHQRFVIDFGDMSEAEARRWPDLINILEVRVKPQRLLAKRESYGKYWWQYAEKRVELRQATRGMERVLVNGLYGPHLSFAFVSAKQVFTNKINITIFQSFAAFSVLQSRVHEVWARFFSSTLKDDLAYAPSDCFETFPFPDNFESSVELNQVGQEYYDFRQKLMEESNEGLTPTYNRFHDPTETSGNIKRLRELHHKVDRAVLSAYGWCEPELPCEFIQEYDDDIDRSDDASASRDRIGPCRLRWTDSFRDEVLARLLQLNADRAEQEQIGGATQNTKKGTDRKKKDKAIVKPKIKNKPVETEADMKDRQLTFVEIDS